MAACTQCGSELTAGARFCPACGHPVEQAAAEPAQPIQPQAFPGGYVVPAPPTDGQAVAALVLGILGLVFCPIIASVVAIILGKSSERKIESSGGTLGGLGLAKAGWILGIIGLVIGLLWIVIFGLIAGASIFGGFMDPGPSVDIYN